MKACGKMRYATTFLTSVRDGGERSASWPCCFTPGEKAHIFHWVIGWLGPRAGLNSPFELHCPTIHFCIYDLRPFETCDIKFRILEACLPVTNIYFRSTMQDKTRTTIFSRPVSSKVDFELRIIYLRKQWFEVRTISWSIRVGIAVFARLMWLREQ
jgi:hypothetical protein